MVVKMPFRLILLGLSLATLVGAEQGRTWRVSVGSGGEEANGSSTSPRVSKLGRFVAFTSAATNFDPDDKNQKPDVYVHDFQTGSTMRVSIASSGHEGNGDCWICDINGDGSVVAFDSFSSNLDSHDTNRNWDIFTHELTPARTACESVDGFGYTLPGDSFGSVGLSCDARYVVFPSFCALVPEDGNQLKDVYARDREAAASQLVSVSSDGDPGNDQSYYAAISGDGRFVSFVSHATNLVQRDMNAVPDVFLHQIGQNSEFYAPSKVTILKGTYNSGTLQSLAADDDDYWIQGAGYDPTDPLAVINSSLLRETNVAAASYRWCSICFVTKCNNLSAKYRIQALRADGSHVTLAEDIPARVVESVLTPLLPNPVSDFIDAANGNKMAVEIRAASSNRVAGFFKHYIDQVEWELAP